MLGVTSGEQRRALLLERRQASRPAELPAELVEGVRKSARLGLIQPLPADVKELHKYQKGATASVGKAMESGWWKSDAGKEWQAERKKLLQADDPLDEPAWESEL